MRPSRGGSRGKTTSRGGLRSADNSGDEAATGRKTQRRVRFEDTDSSTSSSASRAVSGAPNGQTSPNKAASSASASGQRNASQNQRRPTSTQRLFNNALSRAARSPAALTKSFGAASNDPATRPSGAGTASESYPQRYQNLKKTREEERQEAIANGFLADPDKPRTLAEAITPVGTCPDMCPEFERVQRIVQNDVWGPEMEPDTMQTSSKQQPDESRMVKKFRRAAAGIDEQLPSDLRPPHVLQKTIDYLFNDLVENAESLAAVHHFVWDRTRAIRNDFSIQQITKVSELRVTIDCFERIARFHILSLHQLALPEKPYDKYDAQQEREQLDKTLLSLMQYYDDSRGRLQSPNEPEFRAYCVIFQIQDPIPDLEDRVQTWPENIANDARVCRALDLYAAACNVDDVQGPLKPLVNQPIAQGNWAKFWKLVESNQMSYLMSCVAEIYFPLVRRIALNAIWTAFRAAKRTIEDWTLDELVPVLGFQTTDEVEHFCEQYGFTIRDRGDGVAYLDLESVSGRTLPVAGAGTRAQRRSDLVERKRFGRLFSAVISGMSVQAAREAGMVQEHIDQDEEMAEEKSLFISGDSDEEDTQSKEPAASSTNASESLVTNPSTMNPFASAWTPPTAAKDSPNPSKPFFSWPSQPTTNQSTLAEETTDPAPFASIRTANSANTDQTKATDDQAARNSSFATGSSDSSPFSGLFPNQAAQKASSQTVTNPFSFPPSQASSSSPQPSIFDNSAKPSGSDIETKQPFQKPTFSFENSNSAASTSQASPFNTISVQNNASQPAAKEDRPSGFLGTGISAESKGSKSSNAPSPFAGFDTKATAPTFTPFSRSKTDDSQPQQGPTSSKSLFDRTSNDKAPKAPSFSTTNPSLMQPPTFNPFPQTSAQPQSSPQSYSFPPSSSDRQSSPLTNTSGAELKASEQFKLPLFQFTKPSDTPISSSPPANPNFVSSTSTIEEKQPLKTEKSPLSLQNQIKSPQDQAREREAEKAKKSATLDQLARSLVTDSFGFLEQYIEFTVAPMIQAARQQVADEKMKKKADDFRLEKIAKRYATKWREISWGLRVARQGRERRQRMARHKDARERRSRESSISSALDEFRRSLNDSTNDHADDRATAGHHRSSYQFQDNEVLQPSGSRKENSRVSEMSEDKARSLHRRSESVPNRSAILEGPHHSQISPRYGPSSLRTSFLPGDASTSYQPPVASSVLRNDTTRSTYFRLKAMGIDPSGLTRGSDRKRPRSSDSDTATFASPGKRHLTATEAISPVRQPSSSKQATSADPSKPAVTDEDEDLFAAVRQARQAMSDSISFFHDEIAKEEDLGRSRGADGSTPPRTNLEDPLFSQSLGIGSGMEYHRRSGGTEFAPGSQRKEAPPAYRNRVSKFLPRERYADMRMKQLRRVQVADRNDEKETRQSHPRVQSSNAASTSDGPAGRVIQSAPQVPLQPPAEGNKLMPNPTDSMFTRDESSNSSIMMNSASLQRANATPQRVVANHSQPPMQQSASLTNGTRTSDSAAFNHVAGADGKRNGLSTADATAKALVHSEGSPQSQTASEGKSNLVGIKQGRIDARAGPIHEILDESDDDEMADAFEAEPVNPLRHNAFGLLGTMGMDDEGNDTEEEDEEEEEEASEAGGVVDGQSDSDAEDVTDEDENSAGEDEDGYDGQHEPPASQLRPSSSPAPKVTFNGKGGTSVEDAIEL